MKGTIRTAIVLLVLGHGVAGCAGAKFPTAPGTVTGIATPTVTAIVPTIGSTGGNTAVEITGTGFLSGATVTLGGATVTARFDQRFPMNMYIDAPAHEAGTVDVVVTNPTGASVQVVGGYTYVPPASLDFNGMWGGYANDGSDRRVEFTIRESRLISVSCGWDEMTTLLFSPPPPVVNGEFSVIDNAATTMTGQIVSATEARGSLSTVAPCAGIADWRATRSEASPSGSR